jgi:hypothetical protein
MPTVLGPASRSGQLKNLRRVWWVLLRSSLRAQRASCLGREEFNLIGKCFKEEQQCTAPWRTSRELGWV